MMDDDTELDEGLQSFDQLTEEMQKLRQVMTTNQEKQASRDRKSEARLAELRTGLGQITTASQKALDASNRQVRVSILWAGFVGLLIALGASGAGYFLGHRSGMEDGLAEGYQSAQDQQAAASWANTPEGHRAYVLDQLGSLDSLVFCRGNGWKIVTDQKGRRFCAPDADSDGQVTGWFIP